MTATAKPLRIGIVGAGGNTQGRHIPELQKIDGVEIVSVANRSRESSERIATRFGIPRVYDRWQDLVSADDSDAIVIGTWPYLHCEITVAALAAGKHVLCEARMAMNLAEARTMLAAAQARPELVAQVVPAPMTFAVDAAVQRLLGERYVGDLLAVNVMGNGSGFAEPDQPLHWRQDRALSGLNIMSMGIWYETLMRWVGTATTVFAQGKVCVIQRTNPETGELAAVSIPDHLDVLATMESGAQAHFQFSGVTGFAPPPSAWLFGTEGTLLVKPDEEAVFGGKKGDHQLSLLPVAEEERGYWRVEREFVGAVRHEEPVRLTTFGDGVRYMAFTEAVARCLERRAPVSLDDPDG